MKEVITIEKFVSKFEPRKGTEVGHIYLPKEFIGRYVIITPKDTFLEHELIPKEAFEGF